MVHTLGVCFVGLVCLLASQEVGGQTTPAVRPSYCRRPELLPQVCTDTCMDDDCVFGQLCCPSLCTTGVRVCSDPLFCPPITGSPPPFGGCTLPCSDNSDCSAGLICCASACSLPQCVEPLTTTMAPVTSSPTTPSSTSRVSTRSSTQSQTTNSGQTSPFPGYCERFDVRVNRCYSFGGVSERRADGSPFSSISECQNRCLLRFCTAYTWDSTSPTNTCLTIFDLAETRDPDLNCPGVHTFINSCRPPLPVPPFTPPPTTFSTRSSTQSQTTNSGQTSPFPGYCERFDVRVNRCYSFGGVSERRADGSPFTSISECQSRCLFRFCTAYTWDSTSPTNPCLTIFDLAETRDPDLNCPGVHTFINSCRPPLPVPPFTPPPTTNDPCRSYPCAYDELCIPCYSYDQEYCTFISPGVVRPAVCIPFPTTTSSSTPRTTTFDDPCRSYPCAYDELCIPCYSYEPEYCTFISPGVVQPAACIPLPTTTTPRPPILTCETVLCDQGYICVMREVQCFSPPCYPQPQCVRDRCYGITCGPYENCDDGACISEVHPFPIPSGPCGGGGQGDLCPPSQLCLTSARNRRLCTPLPDWLL